MTEHRLDGLEPDNLLAFMALLGLLRSLETACPDWRPRVRWSVDEPPLRPVLRLAMAVTTEDVTSATVAGATALAEVHRFDRSLLDFTRNEAREALETARADPRRADLWAALFSDGAVDNDGLVRKTPANFLDVARVAFLTTLSSVFSKERVPRRGIDTAIADALFSTWRRPDKGLSFRWDPIEDSRHALRAQAPTDDKQGVEHGANMLAALGLRSLVCAPVADRLETRGVEREAGEVVFRWPIWRPALSLAAIEGLLDHPDLSDTMDEVRDIPFVMKAGRLAPPGSRYRNVSRARPTRSFP
jgi:hypothetical protein